MADTIPPYKISRDHTSSFAGFAKSVKFNHTHYIPKLGEFIIAEVSDTGLIKISRYGYKVLSDTRMTVEVMAELANTIYGHVQLNPIEIIPLREPERRKLLREFVDKTMSEHNSNS